jgi:hypothetical protein
MSFRQQTNSPDDASGSAPVAKSAEVLPAISEPTVKYTYPEAWKVYRARQLSYVAAFVAFLPAELLIGLPLSGWVRVRPCHL